MAPTTKDMKCVDPGTRARQDRADEADWNEYQRRNTYATRLERAWPITVLVVLVGGTYEWHAIAAGKFSIDIDGFIFIALLAGMALHVRPIAYVHAFYVAARTTGPILLQFPIYGGMMGIMAHTGLAGLIAKMLFTASTSHTLAFWAFISSCIISLFVPSGGGQWAVVGPVVIPAAVSLGAGPGGCYRYGCANSQHDPALLGIACRAPCRSPGRLSWHRCFSLPRGMSPTQLPRPTLTRNAAYGSSGSAA